MMSIIRRPYPGLFLFLAALLPACGTDPQEGVTAAASETQNSSMPANEIRAALSLDDVLAMQTDEVKARYAARQPKATLEFFGVAPGMTVVETDPGSGWYSGILYAYLGPEGRLVGADYSLDMYPLFEYYSDAELKEKANWSQRWPATFSDAAATGAEVIGFNLGSMPATLDESVDVYLFIRSMHNLQAYEEDGRYLSAALEEAYRVLRPGGVVGIVQHEGPEGHSDSWSSGDNGYLKKSAVIEVVEAAGFTLDGESSVNANPKDLPSEEESVWRLAPTLEPVADAEQAARYAAIGESNRMTLRFIKP